MKRIIATVLCVLYLASTSGATISFHYCMGKYIGWNVSLATSNKCSNCDMNKKENKGCCNDKHQTLQLTKDHIVADANIIHSYTFNELNTAYFTFTQSIPFKNIRTFYSIHSPPVQAGIPSFILYCVFRI